MSYLNIESEKLMPTVKELNQLLAEYHIYYQNLRNFHWNILGENFFELHNKFEELYNDARLKIDEIAERILTLRYLAGASAGIAKICFYIFIVLFVLSLLKGLVKK